MKHFIWLAILLPIGGVAQSLDEARLEFDRFEYEKSAQLFTAAHAEKALKTEDLKRLAYANYVSANWANCLENVDVLIGEKSAEPMHYLMRADALKALKQYAEASEAYTVYQSKDPSDFVDVDIQSCGYLPTVNALPGFRIQKEASNTKKADMRYFDSSLGVIYFHEVGIDSVRNKLALELVDAAEMMFMRPFIQINGSLEMLRFPEKMDVFSVSSFAKDPHSNMVVFTAIGLLEKQGVSRSPQLYVGTLTQDYRTVENVSLWEHSKPTLGEASAFASFVPGESTIVYSLLRKDSKTFSDFYWSTKSDNKWSEPVELANVNTAGEEEYIQFLDGKVYFSSTGRPGYGSLDVYEGQLDFQNKSITSITHLAEPINSPSDEFYYFGKTDTTYITSNRFGSNAEDDVWELIDELQIAEKAALLARNEALRDSLELDEIMRWVPPKIYYEFGNDNPNSDYSFLQKLADILTKYPGLNVEVVGYTDVRGSDEFNQYLSYNRANFIKKQLSEKGIPEERIFLRGEGKALAQENSTNKSSESVHQENRFVIIGLVRQKKK